MSDATVDATPNPLASETNLSHIVMTVLFAGALATVAFDLFGQFISPLLKSFASPFLGSKLAPVGLAQSVLATVTGIEAKVLRSFGIPHGLHLLTGLIAYPLGWLLIVRPIWRSTLPNVHWLIPATVYGVALWVFALFIMAHLIAGMPAFLGFSGITWVALWGHILFALVAVGVIESRLAVRT